MDNEGFTLIELLIVISLLGLISGGITYFYPVIFEVSSQASVQGHVRTVMQSAQAWKRQNGYVAYNSIGSRRNAGLSLGQLVKEGYLPNKYCPGGTTQIYRVHWCGGNNSAINELQNAGVLKDAYPNFRITIAGHNYLGAGSKIGRKTGELLIYLSGVPKDDIGNLYNKYKVEGKNNVIHNGNGQGSEGISGCPDNYCMIINLEGS